MQWCNDLVTGARFTYEVLVRLTARTFCLSAFTRNRGVLMKEGGKGFTISFDHVMVSVQLLSKCYTISTLSPYKCTLQAIHSTLLTPSAYFHS